MKVTIIGVGGLGSALAHGLLTARDPRSARSADVTDVTDVGALADAIELTLCARREGSLAAYDGRARLLVDARAAVVGADVVVLAVKPRGTPELLTHIAGALPREAVVVSCAAGVPLQKLVGHAAVARAMPSIGAQKQQSTTALCLGPGCVAARDLPRLRRVFRAVGEVREVVDEAWLHTVTAVGASGPAFLLLACEALVDAAVEQGLPRGEALAWARGALVAAAARLEADVEPQAVRTLVTSPAGTTAAGLAQLEERAVRAAFQSAVRAAVARSKELG
jgi:pyrroline-5-carboxylate reductase